MKANQNSFAGIAAKAAGTAKVFFFCGPDEAGAHDAAARIVALLNEPGERIELSGGELKRDPVRLGDEARSNSLFGDSRHILVRAQGDEAHDAVEVLLSGAMSGTAEPCPVLIIAMGATDKSRTAKLLADRSDALVAMFYAPDLRLVASAVRNMADGAGLNMGNELAERIARACGLDTRLAQSEVTKLALYLDATPASPRAVEREALDAIGARTEEDGFAPLVNAALGGQTERIAGEIRRMRELGISPVGLLLAVQRRAAQLAGLAAKLGARGDINALLDAERVFFRDKADIGNQLRRWRGRALERLLARLIALHRDMLTHSQDAELLLAQSLGEITRMAARVK